MSADVVYLRIDVEVEQFVRAATACMRALHEHYALVLLWPAYIAGTRRSILSEALRWSR